METDPIHQYESDLVLKVEQSINEKIRSGDPKWTRLVSHTAGKLKIVCKHYVRGLCKKGDKCEFLHEFVMRQMPECQFLRDKGRCNRFDCIFRHNDDDSGMQECEFYKRAFCKKKQECTAKHIKNRPCPNYLAGFCPDGPRCPFGHPKWELPKKLARYDHDRDSAARDADMVRRTPTVCFTCGCVHGCHQPCPHPQVNWGIQLFSSQDAQELFYVEQDIAKDERGHTSSRHRVTEEL
eukprot:gnl/Dysnectes_brevis/1337_a1501_3448.p1 GENE.gnl/Dysnectes_brevis/1337_a1501_3448~~gnl/Dysnectes_brevis/1337_a1501_3448.p1  ORF type:complete len:256 (+),score=32.93 gnl/Dysnectes_brevis/1337_a1501_3448:58-768(+)